MSYKDNNTYTFEKIVGNDPKLLEVKKMARKVAKSSSSIVIEGESGTGKEVLAQAIHNASSRRDYPFFGINCGAIPLELIESELFGYEPGAFTGALKGGKPGIFELASGGTLFLDEIGSMPFNLQVKLLRVLSTEKVIRVGGIKEIPINVRLLSATKKDLQDEVENGKFREDLYYRINVFTLRLPPLRERKGDILLFADYFIKYFTSKKVILESDFKKALLRHCWRGNVRELKNVIERAILLLDDGEKLTLQHLPVNIVNSYKFGIVKNHIEEIKKRETKGLLKIAEIVAIEIALEEKKGNLTKAADYLGIARSTLYQKIKEDKALLNSIRSYKEANQ